MTRSLNFSRSLSTLSLTGLLALAVACGGPDPRAKSAVIIDAITSNTDIAEDGARAICDDIPPDTRFTCAEQASWGKCTETWMRGFCAVSCGRCGGAVSTADDCPGPRPREPERADASYPRIVEHPWMSVAQACSEHRGTLTLPGRADARVVFIGESITRGWVDWAREVWNARLGAFQPINVAVSGDQTQNVLWRIEHGALDGLSPRVVVLMIGINNIGFGGFSPEETAAGAAAVVDAIRTRLPNAQVLHLGILPAMQSPTDPFRRKIEQTNQLFRALPRPPGVTFMDIGDRFLNADGTISPEIMWDYLHPTARGYQLWADAIEGRLRTLTMP